MSKKTIVFDFDGVINTYKSGWKGIDIIPDPPVKGIKKVIDELREKGYEVVIVSTRCAESNGITAICKWLNNYDINVDRICREKPPALVYIDDRALCFDGQTNGLVEKIINFKNWLNK